MDSDSNDVDEDAQPFPPTLVLPSSPPRITVQHAQVTHTSPAASPPSKRIVPTLGTNNPHEHSEDGHSYYRRPNRYSGPASTWLSWTNEERTTVLSLDRLQSQDLSVHLLSAFNLKRKAQELAGSAPKRSKKGKERAESVPSTSENGDEDDLLPQRTNRKAGLSRAWTAWPMPPDQVPREGLLPEMFAGGTRRPDVDARPSANLEDWLIATATSIARQRWDAREWEKEEKPVPSFKRDMTIEHDIPQATLDNDPFAEGTQNQDSRGDGDSPPQAESGDQELFYSQPAALLEDDNTSDLKSENTDSDEEPDRRPVPLADDEKARQYVLPSARHVLSKLDDLLLGLHKARYAYASKPPGRARGKVSQSQTPEENSPRGRSHSRLATRRNARSSSANSNVSSASNFSTMSGKRSRRAEDLGLRDWSDVMGMASLTGWDPAVVERASEGCAKLFGENMLFRTFQEGMGREGAEAQFQEHLAVETDTAASNEEDTEMKVEKGIVVIRTSKPCAACQESKSQCEPPDDRTGTSRECRACLDRGAACSGIRVSSIHDAKVCQHRSCPRHTIPFPKEYHLQRHLDSMHGSHARSKSRSSATSAVRSDINTSDLDDSSRDGRPDLRLIVCPVHGCSRGAKPFSQGKKLYAHVRLMHPEVDISEVKRNEVRRRGERRGRWTHEKRNRGQSRTMSVARRQSQVRDMIMAGADENSGQEDLKDDEVDDEA